MKRSEVLARARHAATLRILYRIGQGGKRPLADQPGEWSQDDQAFYCDCSGLACWALGLSRLSRDPLHLQLRGGWLNTDTMAQDASDPRGIFARAPLALAKPGDLYVFPSGNGRRYGHVGVITVIRGGKPSGVIHCSPANSADGGSAIAETGCGVFEAAGAIVARYVHLEEDAAAPKPAPVGSGASTGYVERGRMSTFGGPRDLGVTPAEGLALIERVHLEDPQIGALFLAVQPPGTSGLARRLNPDRCYIAMRWRYADTPKDFLRRIVVKVTNAATGVSVMAKPVDWGPASRTGRIADLSPGLAAALDLETDQDVIVEVPLPRKDS